MPQSKPMNWMMIFLMMIISLSIMFSFFPPVKASLEMKKNILMKENKMKW